MVCFLKDGENIEEEKNAGSILRPRIPMNPEGENAEGIHTWRSAASPNPMQKDDHPVFDRTHKDSSIKKRSL